MFLRAVRSHPRSRSARVVGAPVRAAVALCSWASAAQAGDDGSAFAGGVAIAAALGLLLPLIGIGLLVGGFVLRSRQRRRAAASVATTGRVVGFEERPGNRAMLYHPVVEFDGPEGVVRFVSALGSRPALHREGEVVKVLYDPSNPQEATLDTALDRWFGPGLMWGMGCAFLALSALLWGAGVLVLLMAR